MENRYDPNKHHRRSIRWKGYDYSSEGLYFITICVQKMVCLFGHIEDGKMILNDAGKMVEGEWLKLPARFPNIELHEFVVMPNHFHAILEIQEQAAIDPLGPAPKTLGEMVGAFESIVTVEYIRGVKNHGWRRFDGKLFQRNYWEHVIRNAESLDNISNYIKTNPENWAKDKFFGT